MLTCSDADDLDPSSHCDGEVWMWDHPTNPFNQSVEFIPLCEGHRRERVKTTGGFYFRIYKIEHNEIKTI